MNERQSSVSGGLSTDTHKVITAGMYSVSVRTTCVQPSGIVITIAQSGSTSNSVSTPTTSPLTADIQLNAQFNCAVNDLITVTLTSSATADQPPALIKTIITLRQGI